jgi:phospholipase C
MNTGDAAVGATNDPIKHVLILALENRSFDHMLGVCQAVEPDIDGIPTGGPPRANSYAGQAYRQASGAARIVVEDPQHETPHVLVQLKADASGTPNAGFVEDYSVSYPMLSDPGRQEIMKYHTLGALPGLHMLAQHLTTWTNHLF